MSRLRAACAAGGLLAVLAMPSAAAAQKDPFVDALIAFRTALAGTYGDEGPQVTARLDEMEARLAEWDRATAAAEADLRAQLQRAGGEEALRLRTTLASLLLERGRLAEARAEIDAAIAIDPKRAAFHLFRGLINDAMDARDTAAEDYRRAWALDPADPIKGYLLLDRAAPADAQPQIDALIAAQPSAHGPASFISLALVEDNAADWPVFAPAAYADGFRLIAERRYPEAVASFRAAAARDPLVAAAAAGHERAVQGVAGLRQKQFAAAVTHLDAAVAEASGSSEIHRLLGIAHGAAGKQAESVEHLETAVRLAPDDERSRVALGRALMKAGEWERAERALREAIAALPQSAEARWALADLLEQRDRGGDAIPVLEAATALPMLAGRGQLLWRLAELLHRHQDFDAVARVLAERVRLNANDAKAHKDVGLAQMRRGARQEALVELTMALLLGGEDGETLATIGQIHLDAGRYDAAEPVLRRAVALAPELPQARFALGTTLVRLGRGEEGRAELAEFQRLRSAALEDQRRTFEQIASPPGK